MKSAEIEINGTEVRVKLTCTSEEDAARAANALIAQLKLAGVEVTVTSQPP
jgi:cell division protein ZapA (FtsZ GTPase activity inhibitor)